MSAKTSSKSTDDVDAHIGEEIRIQRKRRNMTQEELGDHIGVTYQQVQKYEKGMNRVAAAMLARVAAAFRMPVQAFYPVEFRVGKVRR